MQCPRLSQYRQGIVTYRQGFEKQGFFGIFWEILRFFALFFGKMGQFLARFGAVFSKKVYQCSNTVIHVAGIHWSKVGRKK
jgi:hypothetical protein